MKHFFWVLALGLWSTTSGAQTPTPGRQRIENAKIAWITNRINLTADQAKNFWPVYNEYESQKQETRLKIRRLNAETNNLTTSEKRILENLRELITLKQHEVDIDREYLNRFLKVIDVRQLAELYKAEQRFTQMLLERLNKPKNQAKAE
jgi:hypothetical protein